MHMDAVGDLRYTLRDGRVGSLGRKFYRTCQCAFSYHSNSIEGSSIILEQVEMMYDRHVFSGCAKVVDILECSNHFSAFDLVFDRVDEPLSHGLLFDLHRALKNGTGDARESWMTVGAYKVTDNVIAGPIECMRTAGANDVYRLMDELILSYEDGASKTVDDIIGFLVAFERIRPFSDGNGRVGRLIMFKECLRNDIVPFIVTEDLIDYYIRGLRQYDNERGFLRDTVLFAQDRFLDTYSSLAREYADGAYVHESAANLDL